MPEKITGRPIPRAKIRIAPRLVARAKRPLPRAETAEAEEAGTGGNRTNAPAPSGKNVQVAQVGGNADSSPSEKQKGAADARGSEIERIMRIPRLRTDAYLEAVAQGINTQQNDTRRELKRQTDNLRRARGLLEELRSNALPNNIPIPKTEFRHNKKPKIRRSAKYVLVDAMINKKNQQDLSLRAARLAEQNQIVSELEQQVDALEKQDREFEAQKGDIERERKRLRSGK